MVLGPLRDLVIDRLRMRVSHPTVPLQFLTDREGCRRRCRYAITPRSPTPLMTGRPCGSSKPTGGRMCATQNCVARPTPQDASCTQHSPILRTRMGTAPRQPPGGHPWLAHGYWGLRGGTQGYSPYPPRVRPIRGTVQIIVPFFLRKGK